MTFLQMPSNAVDVFAEFEQIAANTPLPSTKPTSPCCKMNDPRTVFKTLSELYQFNKKLAKAYAIPPPKPTRVFEKPSPPPRSHPTIRNSKDK
jgi:hypothetical protein